MNRAIAPGHTQPSELEIRLPQEIDLGNNVRLFWMSDVKDDSVKLDIEWCAGSKYQNRKLVANFANRLLLSGSQDQSASEIASKIDYFGGYLQHEIDRDHAGITLYGLTENMTDIFNVFSEAFLNCEFPEKEFEKERSVDLNRFRIDVKKVKTICRRKFGQVLFGEDSAYGQLAMESDFNAIQREDIRSFYKQFYLGTAPTIFLVGNVDEAFIEVLKEWAGKLGTVVPKFDPVPFYQEKGRVDIPVENAIQSAIRFGRLMFDKNHPDYFKFQLLNTILGGYFGSRLMANIREDKGYTYGIGSGMSVMENGAYFFVSTEVASEVRDNTIQEIKFELNRLRTELISEDELMKVKNYMLGDFLRHADGPMAMMENFKNIHFNQLKTSYYTDFIKSVQEATPEELKALANKYLQEEDLVIVTAG